MASNSAGMGGNLPPADATQAGYLLTTDGLVASWEVSSASLPAMVGNSGKFLTNNGTVASWAAVTADGILPSQTGNNGKVLTTNGTTVSWGAAGSGTVSAAGTFDTTPNTKGVTVSGTDVSLAAADGTNPGGVSAAAQTFGGVKTFSAVPVAAGISAPTTSGFTLAGNVTTGASAVGVTIDNLVALTTAGAKIASFQNHEVEKAFIDKDGALYTGNGTGGCLISDAAGPAEGGIYLGAYAVAPNSNNWAMAIYNPDLYINGPSSIHFRTNGSDAMVMTATSLDMTAFGTGGSIKLKDAGGVTRTCTISAGGAWVIT